MTKADEVAFDAIVAATAQLRYAFLKFDLEPPPSITITDRAMSALKRICRPQYVAVDAGNRSVLQINGITIKARGYNDIG